MTFHAGQPVRALAAILLIGAAAPSAFAFRYHVQCQDCDLQQSEIAWSGLSINRDGDLQPCSHAYDKKVAGVVSGAGNFKPGIILGRQKSQGNALLISLVGKVYCNVDAQYSPIEVGDLLTTSPTPGHAMKAADPWKAFGCVIGKALRPVDKGQRLIPILISLQ